MAVRFNANGDRLNYTSGCPTNTCFTLSFWVYIVGQNESGWDTFFSLSGGMYGPCIQLYAGDLHICLGEAGYNTLEGPTLLSLSTWYHFVWARTSITNNRIYLNGNVEVDDTTTSIRSEDDTGVQWADQNNYGFVFPSCRIMAGKLWDNVVLTQAEAQLEMYSIRPARTANLWGWWPMLPGSGERARDYSGNGRSLTEAGTLEDEDPAPVSWGSFPINIFTVTGVAPTTVNVNAATITASVGAVTADAGIAPTVVNVNAAALSSAAQATAVVPGAVDVSVNATTLVSTAEIATAVPGAVVVDALVTTLVSTAETVTLVPGEAIVSALAATLISSAGVVTADAGVSDVYVELNAVTLSANAGSTLSFKYAYLRPVADTSLGSWTDQDNGSTDIFQAIDEVTASDADYVQSPNNPNTNVYKLEVTFGTDPGIHTHHEISYRYRKPEDVGTVNLTVRLVEGITTRRTWTHNNIPSTWTDVTQTLSEAEAEAITNYADLYVELEATAV